MGATLKAGSSSCLLILKTSFLVLLMLLMQQIIQVSALGGLFGKLSPKSSKSESNKTANTNLVQLTKSSVILGVQHDEDTVTLQVQIEYQQESLQEEEEDNKMKELVWVLPLPAVPTKVQMGVGGFLYHALEKQTHPTFKLDLKNVSKNFDQFDSTTASARVSDYHHDSLRDIAAAYNLSIDYCQASDLVGVCSRTTSDVGNETIPIKDGNQTITNNIDEDLYLIPNNNDKEETSENVAMTSAGIFDYGIIPNDGGAERVFRWLQENNYSLPEPRRDNGTTINSLVDVLFDYEARGNVFMVIQLSYDTGAHNKKNRRGFSHPLMVQYPLAFSSSSSSLVAHSLPIQLTSWTTSPTASIEAYFLSDRTRERAVPINYFDVELDNTFADWLGCHSNGKTMDDCYQNDYHNRFRQVQETLSQPTWMTEHAGPVDQESVHELLSIPQGFTIVLAAQTTWLRFFTSLQNRGIPPTPPVLELLDQYVPPPSLRKSSKPFLTGDIDSAALECHTLDHLYMPGRYDLMSACFDVYVPPTDDWTFDSSGLASDLERLFFSPCRKARDWMKSFSYMTRMYGGLSTSSNLMEQGDGQDPYFVFTSNAGSLSQVESSFSAVAVPLCDNDGPLLLEMTVSKDDDADSAKTFWQPAQFSCDSNTWVKTLDGPVYYSESHNQNDTSIMMVAINKTAATALHACQIVRHPYGTTVRRNETTGRFNLEDILEAKQQCRELLESVIGVFDDGMIVDGYDSFTPGSPSPNHQNHDGTGNDDGNQPSSSGMPYDPQTGESDNIPSEIDSSDMSSESSDGTALQMPRLVVSFGSCLFGTWLLT